MFSHITNYRRQDIEDGRRSRHPWINIGFWLNDVPRPLVRCWLIGHKPVIDGVGEWKTDDNGDRLVSRYGNPSRWVVCDRCGVRGEPQGSLDADRWNVGDRYDGPYSPLLPDTVRAASVEEIKKALRTGEDRPPLPSTRPPGRIPYWAHGVLGGQLVVGRTFPGVGATLKVGNPGSEHVLAASFHFGRWLGALYLHTEGFGRGIQRRLNPTGYHSREIGLNLHEGGRLDWKLWAKRDHWSRDDPTWQQGSVNLNLLDRVLGVRRYAYRDVDGGRTTRMVTLPEKSYLVELRLQRQVLGRRRWRKKLSWTVKWETLGRSIPIRGIDIREERGICGSAVPVDPAAVRTGTWADTAAIAIAARIVEHRTRNGWSTHRLLPVDEPTETVIRRGKTLTVEELQERLTA